MELEKLVAHVEEAIKARIDLPGFRPGKVSLWIKLVRFRHEDGCLLEESVGGLQKCLFTAASVDELINQVADNIVLAIFGAELQLVREMPNLIVKLFDRKAQVPMAGAMPLDQPDQIWLKATVYRYEPGLWERLFGRQSD